MEHDKELGAVKVQHPITGAISAVSTANVTPATDEQIHAASLAPAPPSEAERAERAAQREVRKKAADKPFAERPEKAMKYGDPEQSQNWQVLEPDYIAKRFDEKVKSYERAVAEAKEDLAKLGPKTSQHNRMMAELAVSGREKMLQRFRDKDSNLAQSLKEDYHKLVKEAISHGKPVPEEVIKQKPEFRLAQTARERYEKGRFTSFANKSAAVNDTMQAEAGYKVKRQDGNPITEAQIKEISDGVKDVAGVVGPLPEIMRGVDLTVAHTNGKQPFLTSGVGGLFSPADRRITIGIEDMLGRPVRAFAHELGHMLDIKAGDLLGEKNVGWYKNGKLQDTTSLAEADERRGRDDLIRQATSAINDTREVRSLLKAQDSEKLSEAQKAEVQRAKIQLGPYWREPREVFARLFEQYIANQIGGESTAAHSPEYYAKRPGWWTQEEFDKLAPKVKAAIDRRMEILQKAYPAAAAQPPAAAPPESVAPRQSVSTAKQEQAFPKSVSAPGTYGSDTVVKTPNGDVPAKYKIVEAANLLPSHDAETFAKNPGYPEGVQERAYHSSKEAQARVIDQAQKYDPAYTVNTNPDAVNGPPVVTKTGVVLGGNSRAMATQRLYRRGGANAYRNAISQQAAQFGLDPDSVKDFSRPVLVREVNDSPKTIEEARRLGSDLNRSMTGALGVAEKAVSAGKSITPETLERISGMIDDMGGDASIRDVLRDKGRDIVPMLEKDGLITARERPAFIDTATGGLSEEGKTFVERALRGMIVDDPTLMERAPKSILNKLDGSLSDIVGLAQRTDEYNLLPLIREAIAEHADIAQRGSDVETHLAQSGMFGPERNPAVDAIIRKLADKPKAVKAALRQFAQDANYDKQGQGMLMVGEQPSPSAAFNDAFGTKFTEDELQKAIIDVTEKQLENRSQDVSRTQEEAGGTAGEVQPQPSQESAVTPRESLLSGESGDFTPKAVLNVIKAIDQAYDRGMDAALQKLHMGRALPEVERADPQVARDLRELTAAPQYYRAKAENIVRKITDGMTREQEKGFVLLADQASRDWLRENKPQEYQSYIHDPRITQALQDYKPYEEELRDKQKALGGPTIDEDYLRRVYAEHIGGVDKTVGKGETKTVNANRIITPQMANKKGRIASAEYYYNNGLHEFGPSFATRYVATNLKLAEHRAAINFLTKATKIENKDGLPETIDYNGKTYYRPDVAQLIKAATANSPEGKEIADSLGVDQLPKPKDVQTYSLYDPTPEDKSDYQAKKLAQKLQEAAQMASGTKFREEDMDELLKQAAAISYSKHPLYAGPKEIVEAFQSGAQHAIPGWLRDVGDILNPVSGMVRRQVIGLGLGIPHIKNIMRRVMLTSNLGQLDPRSYGRAAKVLFSKELRERGIKGVDDPSFDALLRHAGISDHGIEAYRDYLKSNLDENAWSRGWAVLKAAAADSKQFQKQLLADIKAAEAEGGIKGHLKAGTTAIAGGIETPFRPLNFIGHHVIFSKGGIDQRARLWLYDFMKAQSPSMSEQDIAGALNDQLGRYNKASWTDFQKDVQPFTFFPGWDYSSVNWVLRHPLKSVLPAAILILLANQALHHFGKNKRKDSTDLTHVHVGNYSITDNLFRERLANAETGTLTRFAQSKLLGKSNEQALRDAIAGVPSDARAFVGMVNPFALAPAEVAFGKDARTGKDIVPEGDRGKRGKPEKDWAWYVAHKAVPAYSEAANPEQGQTVPSFLLHNIGTSIFKNRRKHQ